MAYCVSKLDTSQMLKIILYGLSWVKTRSHLDRSSSPFNFWGKVEIIFIFIFTIQLLGQRKNHFIFHLHPSTNGVKKKLFLFSSSPFNCWGKVEIIFYFISPFNYWGKLEIIFSFISPFNWWGKAKWGKLEIILIFHLTLWLLG